MRSCAAKMPGLTVLYLWVGLLALSTALGADREVHPRERIFPTTGFFPLRQELNRPARLHILYYPNLGDCAPYEIGIVRALKRLEREFQDVQIVTVVPHAYRDLRHIYGELLPGLVLDLADDRSYGKEKNLSPMPRLEVWSGDRQLLLLKSVPPVATEEGIYEELLWARHFTKPVAEPDER